MPALPRQIYAGPAAGRRPLKIRRWNLGLARLYNPVVFSLRATSPAPSRRCLGVLALALLLATMPRLGLAGAAAPAPPTTTNDVSSPTPAPRVPPAKDTKRPGGKRVIALDDDFLVEGKLDKPSAFLLLRRSAIDYDWARLNATLTPLVLESVQDPLF